MLAVIFSFINDYTVIDQKSTGDYQEILSQGRNGSDVQILV